MSGTSSGRYSKKSASQAKPAEKSAWLGFIDIALSDEQRAIVAELNFPDESAISFIVECTSDGYKVSIVEDPAHSCYIASLTGQHPDNVNKGFTLTGRGPTVLGALASLAYKHLTLCDGGLWSNFASSAAKSSWG